MKNQEYTTYETKPKSDIAEGFCRRPTVAGHDRVASTVVLSNPKGKLSRGLRKSLMFFRSFVIAPIEPQEAIAEPVKFARKLTTLRLTQLVRQQKKWAREASTAKHILAKMTPGYSRLRSAMEARHNECLSNFKQVCAEINARELAVLGKLAETELNYAV